jgi:hypothetical protein
LGGDGTAILSHHTSLLHHDRIVALAKYSWHEARYAQTRVL